MTARQARLNPIGIIRSRLKTRASAPKQGSEGAPDAWLEIRASVADGLDGIAVGEEIHRDHLAASRAARRAQSSPAQHSSTTARRRLRHPLSRPAQPDRYPSRDRAQDRPQPPAYLRVLARASVTRMDQLLLRVPAQ